MQSTAIATAKEWVRGYETDLTSSQNRLYCAWVGMKEVSVPTIATVLAPFEHAVRVVANVAGRIISFVGWLGNRNWCVDCSFRRAWKHVNFTTIRTGQAVGMLALWVPNLVLITLNRLYDPKMRIKDPIAPTSEKSDNQNLANSIPPQSEPRPPKLFNQSQPFLTPQK